MFNATGATQTIIYLFCGPLALAYFFNGLIFVSNASFNNLGRPGNSAWINWGRNTIGTWPFVILGSLWFGAQGVLIGQAIGGVIFAVVAVIMAVRLMNSDDIVAEPGPFQSHRRIHNLFNRLR
ncbi:MAG: hypothetical protein AAED33_05920 [Paracoccaceae bacterium]